MPKSIVKLTEGTYIVTGGGRGLGLEIVRRLAEHEGLRVILAVRRPEAVADVAQQLGARVQVERLDVGSLASIRAFCARWSGPIAGLINNAGVQTNGPTRLTADGLEETFEINYFGALALTLGLERWLTGGRVLFIGSGTHDPGHLMARLSGFRGAQFVSLDDCARGQAQDTSASSQRQSGLDRYATSKLLCTSAALALARRPDRAGQNITYYTFDPGMMPGTGLAREASSAERFAWNWLLPALRCVLPDTTTPRRAARSAAWLAAGADVSYESGAVLNYRGAPSGYVSKEGKDPAFADSMLARSLSLLQELQPT